MEIWKKIKHSSYYQVSSKGRIKREEHRKWSSINKSYSLYKEKILKPSNVNSKGYFRIKITYSNGESKIQSVHRLVALTFILNPLNHPQVNHKDGKKENNSVENLEWCTNAQNNYHARTVLGINNTQYGSNSNFAILNEKDIVKISKLLKNKTRKEVALIFNVSPTTITEITSGRSWKHLNIKFPSIRKTSKYKGVFYRKDKNKWGYTFKVKMKVYQSCKYKTEKEAYEKMTLEKDIVRSSLKNEI